MSLFNTSPRWIAVLVLAGLLLGSLPAGASGADQPPEIDESLVTSEQENQLMFTGCSPVYTDAIEAAYEQRVVELVNDHRASIGKPPLKRVQELDYAARFHARDMAEDRYFYHDSYDRVGENLVRVCLWYQRVDGYYSNRTWLGENIAAGYATPESVFQGWYNSEGHRNNMESSNYWEIGIGYFRNPQNYPYWVQDFGQRRNIYPIIINREYAQTSNPDVELFIYGQGAWDEMRLRNDNDAWTAWQPFQPRLNWRLNWKKGTRTVTVELRRFNPATAVSSSDTIELTSGDNELIAQPTSIFFIYNQAAQKLIPEQVALNISNNNENFNLEWVLECAEDWIILSNTIGSTPDGQANISISQSMFAQTGSYEGQLTITVTNPAGVAGSPRVIPVRLAVVEDMPYAVFMPVINR